MRRLESILMLAASLAAAAPAAAQVQVRLGPKDGAGLPGSDLERIRVGDPAPDFTLEALDGPPVTLSELRGRHVILVFYRGHW